MKPNVIYPREIVSELDKYIVTADANGRWPSLYVTVTVNVDPSLRDEIAPKNIILIGSTGVGKTEIARRLANWQTPLHKS